MALYRISIHSFMKKHSRPTHPQRPPLWTTVSTCTKPICHRDNYPRYCLSTLRLPTSGQIPPPSRRRLRHPNYIHNKVARLRPISTRIFRYKILILTRLVILPRLVDLWIWKLVSSCCQHSIRSPKRYHHRTLVRLETRNRN